MMLCFSSDYTTGAHPRVLEALQAINLRATTGYGMDADCRAAAECIREMCGAPQAQVHFLVGGTQANLLLIAAALRPHEAAICAETGHINVHETGAVEATGHKVLGIPAPDGKVTREGIEIVLAAHADEHMVKPALVYISNTTEVGTVYTEAEIEAIGACCRENELLLYVDGARMGSAIAAGGASLQTLARCADAFTIGGTKNGALFGEAMVLVNPALTRDFRYIMKQRGAMLAKGWLLGAQFAALFQDNLYFDMAAHANAMAQKLARGLAAKGYEFLYPPVSNQLFPVMRDDTAQRLMKRAQFQRTQPLGDGESVWRFVTSWSTQEADVDALIEILEPASAR